MSAKSVTVIQPNTKPLGTYMKTCRLKQNLSLMDVADYMNWSSSQFVWNFENESSTVPLKSIKKLAGLYKIKDLDLRRQIADYHIRKIQKKYGLIP